MGDGGKVSSWGDEEEWLSGAQVVLNDLEPNFLAFQDLE